MLIQSWFKTALASTLIPKTQHTAYNQRGACERGGTARDCKIKTMQTNMCGDFVVSTYRELQHMHFHGQFSTRGIRCAQREGEQMLVDFICERKSKRERDEIQRGRNSGEDW